MLKVSLRDFQLKPSKYLQVLPIMLTRYDKDIAIVDKASNLLTHSEKSVNTIRQGKSDNTSVVTFQEDVAPKLQPSISVKKKGRVTSYGVQLCEHNKPYNIFCNLCGS